MYIYIYLYVYLCIFIFIYIYMYIYIYIYQIQGRSAYFFLFSEVACIAYRLIKNATDINILLLINYGIAV